jgi:hypothetical protein
MLNKEDVWGNSVTEFFDYADEKEQLLWSYLFEKIIEVTPRSYKKQILPIVEKIGEKPFRKTIHAWLELVILAKPKTAFYEDESGLEHERNYLLEYPNETIFARLIRTLPFVAYQNSIDLLSELAVQAGKNRTFKSNDKTDKVTGIASYKLSEQAIYALADIEKVSPITALLSVQIQLQSLSLKALIEKKLSQIAKKQKVELIELLENHLPDYGLENGFLEGEIESKINAEKIYVYQMQVVENKVKISWFDANGKQLKTVPAALKKEFPHKIEKLKSTAIEAQKTLTLQRERLEKTYLTHKNFTYSHWKNAYSSHGLLGVVVENLVWQVNIDTEERTEWKTVWSSFGRFVDADKNPIEVNNNTLIRLLHPVSLNQEDLEYWQNFIKQKDIKQPFQQVFRTIFERIEGDKNEEENEEIQESNRFEGIILTQKKLRMFAKIQGWNYKWLTYPKVNRSFVTFQFDYKLNQKIDNSETEKPQKLEIEFWVEALPSQPQDVKTSVVRLHKKAQPLSLEILDKITFSEIFRAIQRIVNVSSLEIKITGNQST